MQQVACRYRTPVEREQSYCFHLHNHKTVGFLSEMNNISNVQYRVVLHCSYLG